MATTPRPRRQAAPIQDVAEWEERPRIDSLSKVTGSARYIDDLPAPPGTLYAACIRSPYSHARILSIDASDALALPGVHTILDRDHLDGLDPTIPMDEYTERGEGIIRGEEGLLAVDKVRFDGDLVAMVAAEDPRIAEQAAELVRVEYEPLTPVYSYEAALAEDAPLIHEEIGSNVAIEDSFEWGDADVDGAMQDADHVIEDRWFSGNAFHHPMEPAVSAIADYRGERLDIVTSTHQPYRVQAQLSKLLGMAPENVRVRVPYIGGGFGAKHLTAAVGCTAALSSKTGRPVKYTATEFESFRQTSRHAIEYRARMGLRSDGTIVALDVSLAIDTGAYFTGAAVVTHNACISAWGCYRIPSYRVRATTVYTNKVPAASFRATGKNQTTFGIESMIEAAARLLGLSPIEIRKRNALARGEYVSDTWRVRGQEFAADTPPMDTDFDELIDRAVAGIGWNGSPKRHSAKLTGSKFRGRGLALSLRHGAQGGGRAYAMVALDRDGVVSVHHNAPDLGTGVFTVLTVVASQTLGIPQDQVRVMMPDTSNNMPFGGTSAQRTTVQMGNAVRAACEDLKRELIDAATQTVGGPHDEWRYDAGRLWRGNSPVELSAVLSGFRTVSLRGVGSYSYAPSVDRAFGGLDHWAPGAAACEVEVDLDTGVVRVLKYCAVGDAGKAIHRQASQGQVAGGAMQGIGLALHEELVYEGSRLANGNPFDYRLANQADLPDTFVVDLIEHRDGPGPYGAKGLSQTSLPCAAPAIGNAIRDALGVFVQTYPFTPDRVLRAIGRLPVPATEGWTEP